MEREELQTLLLQTAEVLEQFRRLSAEASQSQKQSAEELSRIARTAPSILRQASDENLSNLSNRIKTEVTGGLNQAAEDLQRRLLDAGNQLTGLTHGSKAISERLERVVNRLLCAVSGSLALMVIAIAGGTWLSQHYYRQITENQVSAELMKAYNAADVVLCNGKLCANVDDKSARYGDKGKYALVRGR